MKKSQKKIIQTEYAKKTINKYFELIKNNFNSDFNKSYISEIKKTSKSFNIRLTREEKLNFCNKCEIKWDVNSREIRLNPSLNTKEYICKYCGYTRKFKYK